MGGHPPLLITPMLWISNLRLLYDGPASRFAAGAPGPLFPALKPRRTAGSISSRLRKPRISVKVEPHGLLGVFELEPTLLCHFHSPLFPSVRFPPITLHVLPFSFRIVSSSPHSPSLRRLLLCPLRLLSSESSSFHSCSIVPLAFCQLTSISFFPQNRIGRAHLRRPPPRHRAWVPPLLIGGQLVDYHSPSRLITSLRRGSTPIRSCRPPTILTPNSVDASTGAQLQLLSSGGFLVNVQSSQLLVRYGPYQETMCFLPFLALARLSRLAISYHQYVVIQTLALDLPYFVGY
ncbi:hypothetical protein C8J57DRAFT_1718082 [Mycena rebaudengoi]|nr:hypothetical protein C8J57DRAFT_1718082 [Mycena rebaudengoi]